MSHYLHVTSGSFSDIIRSGMALDALKKRHRITYDYTPIFRFDNELMDKHYNAVIFSRPIDARPIRLFKSKGIPVIVDYDDDFYELPKNHVAYNSLGQGNPKAAKEMQAIVEMADAIVVSTDVLKERFEQRYGRKINVIYNGWNSDNPNWNKATGYNKKNRIAIGWSGTATHHSDFQLVTKALQVTLEKNPDVMLIISGDPDIYKLFSTSRENQKLFISPVSYDRYPLVIGLFDILIAPLQENKFNQAKSEIKLVDAGAKRIPWIASPSCSYLKWGVGGSYASNMDEWISAFMSLVYCEERRVELGEIGHHKAKKRDTEHTMRAWNKIISMVEV